MPYLEANTVISTALTDLLNAIVLLPLLLLMHRHLPKGRPESRLWKMFMTMVALASFIGFVLHIHPWSRLLLICIWVPLYATMFQGLHSLLLLAIHTARGSTGLRPGERSLLQWIEGFMLSMLIVFLLLDKNPIRLFLFFGVALIVPSFYFFFRLALRGHHGSRILLTAILPLIAGLPLQIMRRSDVMLGNLDFNGIYHLCILISILIFYAASKKWES